ncbi:hypothetical protein AWRI1631_80790 [Saccharomyces cerevisiae AWRI1631]|uniref:Uncharacterized protein n=1 Tax=Saccharomyces cerevisiae (strain AWRI1631) TaxID=545124 RepID=B5VJV8_YEAS6|nr:hypothetical protein AWRI1631_80790 [Saccharomyces cerevisiae AWRI1631]
MLLTQTLKLVQQLFLAWVLHLLVARMTKCWVCYYQLPHPLTCLLKLQLWLP